MVRFKHRYLVATVATSPPGQLADLGAKEILAMIRESIATNFGEFGAGNTSAVLQVRSFDADSGVCVIRTGRDSHRMVRASLTLLAGTKDARLSITVEGVAGSERTLKTVAIEAYARAYRRAGLDEDAVAAMLERQWGILDAQ